MRRILVGLFIVVCWAALLPAQTNPAKSTPAQGKAAPAKPASAPAAQAASPAGPGLEAVLTKMDQAAAQFRATQANFEWDQYNKVINETDVQSGIVYFRRSGKENVEMMADIKKPEQKFVLFNNGIVQVYQPKIEQVTQYNAGKNRADFESFLVLGFGGRGHDLAKSFEVRYGGTENIAGINTAKLELTPKQKKVRNLFNRIVLWIDPARGISVQQQFFDDGSGDYRLAKYSNIKINEKLPDNVFKLKTTGKTKTVTPQG